MPGDEECTSFACIREGGFDSLFVYRLQTAYSYPGLCRSRNFPMWGYFGRTGRIMKFYPGAYPTLYDRFSFFWYLIHRLPLRTSPAVYLLRTQLIRRDIPISKIYPQYIVVYPQYVPTSEVNVSVTRRPGPRVGSGYAKTIKVVNPFWKLPLLKQHNLRLDRLTAARGCPRTGGGGTMERKPKPATRERKEQGAEPGLV